MINKREKVFYLTLIIALAILALFAIFSIVYILMVVFQNDTFLTYIFEIIYSVVHLLIVIYALILSIKAYREGSWVMKTLMYTRMNESVKSNMAAIISMLTAIFSFLIFVYSTLMLFNVVPGLSSFPLKLDLVNVAISVFTVALYFNLYPRIVDKNKGGN